MKLPMMKRVMALTPNPIEGQIAALVYSLRTIKTPKPKMKATTRPTMPRMV
jgi:hypothetical protein